MIIQPAKRTESVQEYYFSRKLKEIAAMNEQRAAAGEEPVINLGIGSPDGMPPMEAIETLCHEARQSGNHAYQSYVGLPQLRQAFADWYARWYGVELNPANEIQPLVGSKEGILPGYPTYSSASKLVEAEMVSYDLKAENGWQPDFEALEKMDLSGVKIMWTNYPNMPTGAPATEQLYAKLIDFALRHNILICNDNPYSFILNDNPLSILAQPRAKECCLELNSLSKAHNMAGWRIGMVAGDKEMIAQVLKVKSQMDSGMFKPLQMAAVRALQQGPEWFSLLNDEYRRRRALAGEIFDLLGAEYDHHSSGMFLWGKVESGRWAERTVCSTLGEQVSDKVLYEAGVFITPGFIFGRNGEDYIRISLCAKPEVLKKAAEKIKAIL